MFNIKKFENDTFDFVRVCSSFGLKDLIKQYKKNPKESELGRLFVDSKLYKFFISQKSAFSPLTEQQVLNILCDSLETTNCKQLDISHFLKLIHDKVDSKALFSIPEATEPKLTTSERLAKTIRKVVSDIPVRFSFIHNLSSNNNNNNIRDESDNSSENDSLANPFKRTSS